MLSTLDNLPPPGSSLEEDYQRLLVSLFRAKAAQEADSVYAQYYDFSEAVGKIAGHRVWENNIPKGDPPFM